MGKPPFYIIIDSFRVEDLQNRVNEMVEEGYAPTGPIVMVIGPSNTKPKLLKEMIYVSRDPEHTDEEVGEPDAD